MENCKFILFVCLLTTSTLANEKLKPIPLEKIETKKYFINGKTYTIDDLRKPDCYFGPGTSASTLEYIHYDLIVNHNKFKSDPNLLP